MNQDNPLTPSTYAYFTGNGLDMRGAIAARLTDGTNIETADGITTNLVSGGNGGGCVTFGSLPSLNTGAVTFQLDYDNPDYDSENDAPITPVRSFLAGVSQTPPSPHTREPTHVSTLAVPYWSAIAAAMR